MLALTLRTLAQYFDSIAAEIDDLLQEAGQISLSDLAVQYALSTELVARVVSERVGSTVKVSAWVGVSTRPPPQPVRLLVTRSMLFQDHKQQRCGRGGSSGHNPQSRQGPRLARSSTGLHATQGRLEAGLLYTSSYLRNVKASLRGALRGVAQPTTMTAVVKVHPPRFAMCGWWKEGWDGPARAALAAAPFHWQLFSKQCCKP